MVVLGVGGVSNGRSTPVLCAYFDSFSHLHTVEYGPSTKVNLHHAIKFRALYGANLVTQRPIIWGQRNPLTTQWLSHLSHLLAPRKGKKQCHTLTIPRLNRLHLALPGCFRRQQTQTMLCRSQVAISLFRTLSLSLTHNLSLSLSIPLCLSLKRF